MQFIQQVSVLTSSGLGFLNIFESSGCVAALPFGVCIWCAVNLYSF